MKRILSILFVALLAISLSSCATIDGWRDATLLKAGYTQKARVESLLAQTKAEYDKKLAEKDAQISLDEAAFVKGLNDKLQSASNSLYGADFAFQLLLTPDRTHLIMENHVREAQVVLPPPTVAAMAAENARVKAELNETLTSLATLQKTHETVVAKAKELSDRVDQDEAALKKDSQDKIDLEKAKTAAVNKVQADLNKANDDIEAKQKASLADAKSIQAAKEKMALYLGVIGLAALAGAIWSPVFKPQLGLFAGVCSLAAVGIFYITGTVILCIAGVGIALLIGWAVLEHNQGNKAAIATYGALEEIKAKAGDTWTKDIAPTLTAWQSKYVTVNGQVTTVPDPSIATHIDKTLAASNLK